MVEPGWKRGAGGAGRCSANERVRNDGIGERPEANFDETDAPPPYGAGAGGCAHVGSGGWPPPPPLAPGPRRAYIWGLPMPRADEDADDAYPSSEGVANVGGRICGGGGGGGGGASSVRPRRRAASAAIASGCPPFRIKIVEVLVMVRAKQPCQV